MGALQVLGMLNQLGVDDENMAAVRDADVASSCSVASTRLLTSISFSSEYRPQTSSRSDIFALRCLLSACIKQLNLQFVHTFSCFIVMTIYLYLFQSQPLTGLLELALNFLWSNFS